MQHATRGWAQYVRENRKTKFQEAYEGWSEGRLTQVRGNPPPEQWPQK